MYFKTDLSIMSFPFVKIAVLSRNVIKITTIKDGIKANKAPNILLNCLLLEILKLP